MVMVNVFQGCLVIGRFTGGQRFVVATVLSTLCRCVAGNVQAAFESPYIDSLDTDAR